MLAAVEITSLARNRIPNRVWRRIHMLSFAVFLLASAHFIAAGTDASSPVVIIGLLGLISTVVALTALRVAKHRGADGPRPPVSPRPPRPGRARGRLDHASPLHLDDRHERELGSSPRRTV